MAPSQPTLLSTSDSGLRDNITSDATPTFNGTWDGNETGVAVYMRAGGTDVGGPVDPSSGSWTITTSTQNDGVRSYSARAVDLAGNTADGPVVSITIGTLPFACFVVCS